MKNVFEVAVARVTLVSYLGMPVTPRRVRRWLARIGVLGRRGARAISDDQVAAVYRRGFEDGQ